MKKLNIDYKKHIGYSRSAERGIKTRLCQKYDPAECERLMEQIDPETATAIRDLYRQLVSRDQVTAEAQPAPSSTRSSIAASPIAGSADTLRPWRSVVAPKDDVARGRFKTAEFALDLATVAKGDARFEYQDPKEFFSRTYITEGMRSLLITALKRVSVTDDDDGDPVVELKTAFGIEKLLSPKTAREIFDECNEKLQQPEYTARGFMRRYNVECVCTTDDPVDDLRWHKATRESGFEIKMIPAWRPDKAMNIEKPEFSDYVKQLAKVADMDISSFKDMVDALQKRHDFFHENGCRLSDHGIEEFYDEPYTDSQIETIFEKALRGQQLSNLEIRQYKHAFLRVCAEQDYAADWTQQYHYGAIRDNNTLMYNQLGPDTGFDSIGEFNTAKAMSHFLNELNVEGKLTRTILYTLNPCANEVIATMLGNFQDGSCPGKIQFGSGWWFNDQLDGMTRQMNALSVLGLLSRFVGMLTDSRSFLSYPRHEYFRRLLCNLLGNDVEKGLLPNDMESLSRMVEDISYNNARRYFKFY